ncbi:hypothetical protein GII30_04660 [Gordonia amarae]|nr:hypothetical protein [Gordonia amarae]MCS3877656.1 hypothetical protein [Gordonia amarae]QHN16368.1 hypothetical protein GII35_04665 [Gordonia amarae]QHN20937.1 hypothetical protein GII34_04665 [Gordonia amarae]QHN38563.1 hypothetical protein GII30_04660 [Gordonia amarae]
MKGKQMFKKMVLAVLGLMMALGVMSVSAATAVADHGGPHNGPGGGMSQENILVITVVKYGDRWNGPQVTVRTKWGNYVASAYQVGRQDYGKRTEYKYVARNLPWYKDLKVEVSGRGHYSGNRWVRFEYDHHDDRVIERVYLTQQWGGGGWN